MLKWKKLGRIFNPIEIKGLNWLNEFAQAPHVVHFDNFLRVYFSCRPKPDSNGQYVSYSAYVDLNKNNLFEIIEFAENPILKLGVSGTFDEFGTYPVSVVKYKDEYRVYYAGWTRCESVPFNVAIGIGISKDEGKNFEKIGDGPILSYSVNEPFILSGPKIRFFNNLWYLFYIGGKEWIIDNGKPEPIYTIKVATSIDGINFIKFDKDIIPQKLNDFEAQASPDVIYKNGKYHMFFCYRQGKNYRGKEGGYRIGYASSLDLLTWERNDDMAGLDVSSEGWDSEMVSYPHVFELNGKIYMFYLGNHVGKFGFGLAELENDL